jgi:hypothetical protein
MSEKVKPLIGFAMEVLSRLLNIVTSAPQHSSYYR